MISWVSENNHHPHNSKTKPWAKSHVHPLHHHNILGSLKLKSIPNTLNTFTSLMLKFAKRPFPMIGKISELLVHGNRAGFSDTGTSPRSPLDLKMQPSPSPRGLKSYDVGCVGLGIVAALEKSAHSGREILAKYGVFSPKTNRSDPIPVNSGQNSDGFSSRGGQEFEEDSLENYTYVTLRGQNKPCTKVYYDGGDCAGSAMHRRTGDGGLTICDDELESSDFPTSDFLSCCHLCKKSLHGKDIYMYRYTTLTICSCSYSSDVLINLI